MIKSARAALFSLTATGLLIAAATVSAAEYQSVGNDPAILYNAPTLRGNRIAVAPRGMPVEMIFAQDDGWARIRDSSGGLAWVEKKSLVAKRTVVATDPGVLDVHAGPDDNAPIVFRVQPGVLMDLAAPPAGGWVNVRHRDGQSGYVRVGSVWGE
jgi:SH3-like domain-containing protein